MTTRSLENQEMNERELERMGVKLNAPKEEINTNTNNVDEDGLVEGISFGEDPSEKKYLLFFIYSDEDGNDVKDWEIIIGRDNFYQFIKDNAETMDMLNSKALTGSLTVEEAVCVADIIKSFKSQGMYRNDGFDIEEYI